MRTTITMGRIHVQTVVGSAILIALSPPASGSGAWVELTDRRDLNTRVWSVARDL